MRQATPKKHTGVSARGKWNLNSTLGTTVPPIPGGKIRFHFHSTFPAKPAKLEIHHFRTFGNKKRLETEVSSLFHSLELVEISGIEPLTS